MNETNIGRTFWHCCVGLLLGGLGLLWMPPAHAAPPPPPMMITCTASMSALVFGTVDPQSSQTDANATLNYMCANSNKKTLYATVCFSIGEPAGGPTNPRQMHDTAGDTLNFQLYQNASYSVVWGSQFFGAFRTPLQVDVTVPGRGSIAGTATMYGQVLNGQTTAIPGNYLDIYMNGDTATTINENNKSPPGSCSGTSTGNYFPFTVTATVANQCTVSASPLDFGNVGLLTAATPGTSSISVQCATGTAYNVGLDAGLNGGGNINTRKMVLGASAVGYQLYQNSGHTVVWGNTVGSNTVAGTGTGNTQNLTVYGSVPAQTTPPAGTYHDTITVTVTY